MATVELRKVEKSFGKQTILHALDLTVEAGEFMVLVGPSGCGKSTLLRMIAGLEAVSAGELAIGGRPANGLGPKERGVAMVFQSYALYPHMTVRENLAFALKLAKLPRAEIDARIKEAAGILAIEALLDKKPGTLSGGQKQRVAMGRAMVRRPAVFLFDEPLSNLDAQLRVRMRSEIAELHRKLGATIVYVTHDQVEAMTLASRIAVLNAGRLEQVGAPLDVYRRPRTRFVAGFIGTPSMNFLPRARVAGAKAPEGTADVGFRPEETRLGAAGGGLLALGRGRVRLVEPLGSVALVHVQLPGDDTVVAEVRMDAAPAVGNEVEVAVPEGSLFAFGADGLAQ